MKEYLQRFNFAALEVPTATSNALICVFTQVLQDGDFFKSLTKKSPSQFCILSLTASHLLSGRRPSSNHLIMGILKSSAENIARIVRGAIGFGSDCIVMYLVLQSSKALASLERQSTLTFSYLDLDKLEVVEACL
ncbi:UNVERIFIED_CONTAM: hypothetical protein Sradi_3580900 [Sesamum radiatum]|uniref:Uncharacterized protein n=1 Tax=Sesamum radiatum TaxID=300843 RepID=A0AAW2QI71_SESRA